MEVSSHKVSRRGFCELALVGALGALVPVTVSACSSARGDTVITVEACDSTVKYRETVMFPGDDTDCRWATDEHCQEAFETMVESQRLRAAPVFPNVQTRNELGKDSVSGGGVYTLGTGGDYDIAVMCIHGGSWAFDINDEQVAFCDELVDLLNAKVFIPLYPLAPQATASESYAMLRETYRMVAGLGKPVVIVGDSAGGSLALGLVHELMASGEALPSKIVVMAPCADATFSNPEIDEYQKVDGMLSKIFLADCVKLWAGERDLTDADISPLYGDYDGFPDTLMYVGDHDILCPDDLKLYDKMSGSDMNVELVKGVGFWHVYLSNSIIEEHDQLMRMCRDFCLRD